MFIDPAANYDFLEVSIMIIQRTIYQFAFPIVRKSTRETDREEMPAAGKSRNCRHPHSQRWGHYCGLLFWGSKYLRAAIMGDLKMTLLQVAAPVMLSSCDDITNIML